MRLRGVPTPVVDQGKLEQLQHGDRYVLNGRGRRVSHGRLWLGLKLGQSRHNAWRQVIADFGDGWHERRKP